MQEFDESLISDDDAKRADREVGEYDNYTTTNRIISYNESKTFFKRPKKMTFLTFEAESVSGRHMWTCSAHIN